jgi:hypothetical protein
MGIDDGMLLVLTSFIDWQRPVGVPVWNVRRLSVWDQHQGAGMI